MCVLIRGNGSWRRRRLHRSVGDWSHHVRDVLPRLPYMADVEQRELTELEYYVITRTTHGPIRSDLLDSFPLHVAITACELFGAVALYGRTANLKTLTDDEWRAAGGAGFSPAGTSRPRP